MLDRLAMCDWQYRRPAAWLLARLTSIFVCTGTVPSHSTAWFRAMKARTMFGRRTMVMMLLGVKPRILQ